MEAHDLMTIPTFPMRPTSAGPWPKAREHFPPGKFAYEPKYNGWRALVHIPTGTMFNRHGDKLTIAAEFDKAVAAMRELLGVGTFQWADCEALERRHNIGRGSLIIFDVIPDDGFDDATYTDRRAWLMPYLDQLEEFVVTRRFDRGPFPLLSMPPQVAPDSAWGELQEANRILGCEFYEGLVGKTIDSVYEKQLRSDASTPTWVKHRWRF